MDKGRYRTLADFWQESWERVSERNGRLHMEMEQLRQLCNELRKGKVKDE